MNNNLLSSHQGDLISLFTFSKRDKPWDGHKSNSLRMADKFYDCGYERYHERILECANRLEFIKKDSDNADDFIIKLFNAKFCRVRLCPICQWRKSMRWVARLYEALPKILEDNPKVRFIFLTLTVPNCELYELRETIQQMNKAWRRLAKLKVFPGIGYIKSLEVTINDEGQAHPHFHIVIAVTHSYFGGTNYLSQKKWTELWQKSLRTKEKRIVNVKAIKPKGSKDDTELDKLVNALRECVKYSTKPDDLLKISSDDLATFTQQMHKLRTVSLGGIFKKYMSEEEPEDLIGESQEKDGEDPKGDITAIWHLKKNGYYISDK